jgi:LysM repeat protein
MRQHDSSYHADRDVPDDEVTSEFWGSTRAWVSRQHRTVDAAQPRADCAPADTTGSLRAIRDGLAAFRPSLRSHATGEIERTRQHGTSPRPFEFARDATLGELASGWSADDDDPLPVRHPRPALVATEVHQLIGDRFAADDDHDVEFDVEFDIDVDDDFDVVPLTPVASRTASVGFSAVDPLLLRLGVLVMALILLVPLALSLRPHDEGAIVTEPGSTVPAAGDAPAIVAAASPTSAAPPATGAPFATEVVSNKAVAESSGRGVSARAGEAESASSTTPSVGDVVQSEIASSGDEPVTVSASAERILPLCPQTYEAGVGDSWYRIADAAGITPSALLSENRATVDTVILPGDEICLPADATIPTQPTTTTAAPIATAPSTTAPPTTQPPSPATPAEAQQIIRDVWPDELEEKALAIAWRESGYVATAYNGWCCYGLFQIYWTVHRSWLDDLGITSADDLLDARANAEAALELYRRAGGWGPWGG